MIIRKCNLNFSAWYTAFIIFLTLIQLILKVPILDKCIKNQSNYTILYTSIESQSNPTWLLVHLCFGSYLLLIVLIFDKMKKNNSDILEPFKTGFRIFFHVFTAMILMNGKHLASLPINVAILTNIGIVILLIYFEQQQQYFRMFILLSLPVLGFFFSACIHFLSMDVIPLIKSYLESTFANFHWG